MNPPVVLTIAGSDPSGGAGIAADLATFAALGVHGTAVITAVTAQNTVGVQGTHPLPTAFVEQQLESVLGDLPVAAVKTGMLANTEIVELVSRYAGLGQLPNLVVDPVMVASSGDRLLDASANSAYLSLLECSLVATPNVREAAVLAELLDPSKPQEQALAGLGADLLVVTGEQSATDRVHHNGSWITLAGEPVATPNDHGTGCTFSAAVAAGLAASQEPMAAVRAAKKFVHGQILRSATWRIGAGRGPVSHIIGTQAPPR